jgi:hypothetical protein
MHDMPKHLFLQCKNETFEYYTKSVELLEVMPITCYEEQIFKQALHLSGWAGPYGVDDTTLKGWFQCRCRLCCWWSRIIVPSMGNSEGSAIIPVKVLMTYSIVLLCWHRTCIPTQIIGKPQPAMWHLVEVGLSL